MLLICHQRCRPIYLMSTGYPLTPSVLHFGLPVVVEPTNNLHAFLVKSTHNDHYRRY